MGREGKSGVGRGLGGWFGIHGGRGGGRGREEEKIGRGVGRSKMGFGIVPRSLSLILVNAAEFYVIVCQEGALNQCASTVYREFSI